jgi:hypothetical protein
MCFAMDMRFQLADAGRSVSSGATNLFWFAKQMIPAASVSMSR